MYVRSDSHGLTGNWRRDIAPQTNIYFTYLHHRDIFAFHDSNADAGDAADTENKHFNLFGGEGQREFSM